MPGFRIDLPALSRGLLDRSEDVREPARVAATWPSAKILQVGPAGRLPVTREGPATRLEFTDAARLGDVPPPGAVLLGSVGGTDYWAVDAAVESAATIRSVGPLLSDDHAALATTAVALLGWHAAAGFCPQCGRPTQPDATGHSRSCSEGHQEFPRTDPAVIVLVHDGQGNAVLARQASWAPGRFSVLAGFAEAGESLEGTVVREIGEEIGVRVGDVQYLGSQPWPFPRSLMIGFEALAPVRAVLRPRPGEIEQARWFSRQQLREIMAGRVDGGITLPDSVSIARRMVEGFVAAG